MQDALRLSRKHSASNSQSWVDMKKILGVAGINFVIIGSLAFLLNALSIIAIPDA